MSEQTFRIPDSRTGSYLVGILRQARGNEGKPTRGRPIAILIHGVWAHKNQTWHVPLAKRLDEERDLDSFRFDFSANGDSPGTFHIPGYEEEVQDLECVADWLASEFGYRLHLLIPHSRGVMSTLEFISRSRHTTRLPLLVNISGRYTMSDIYASMAPIMPIIEEQGFYDITMSWGKKETTGKVTKADVDAYATWPVDRTLALMPPVTDVLILQGTNDDTVRYTDGNIFRDILSQREPGTTTLRFIEGADHKYSGFHNKVNDEIMDWLGAHDTAARTAIRAEAFSEEVEDEASAAQPDGKARTALAKL